MPLCTAHPAAELEYFLDDSAASVVMGSGKYKAVVEPLARARGVTFVDVDDHVDAPLAAADSAAAAFVPLEGLCAEHDLAERPAMVRIVTGRLGVDSPWFSWRGDSRTTGNCTRYPHCVVSSSFSLVPESTPPTWQRRPIVVIIPSLSPSLPWSFASLVLRLAHAVPLHRFAPQLIYTSGTTGRPKGVVNRHSALQAQITNLVDAWEWAPDDRILHLLPLHHVHGVVNKLLCALWSGAIVDFMAPFDAHGVWGKFARSEADGLTLFMAVPTVYAKLVECFHHELTEKEQAAGAAGAARLRLMVSGSAALPVSVLQEWEKLTGHFLLERYGMTEFGMAISNPLAKEGRREGRVGQPLPNVECVLVDESGAVVPDGEQGEIRVRGPIVFKEYWGRPEASAEEFDADGFFKTGDIGERDAADGSIKIVGRASVDIIKSGGYKISALDVERMLLEHPSITEAYVVGVEDDTWGQLVGAVVRMEPGHDALTLDDVRSWGRDRAAKYKLPSELRVVDDIPKNPTGKVNKKQLLAELF